MINLFSFQGALSRRAYALTALPVFFSQYLFVYLVTHGPHFAGFPDALFWFQPLRTMSYPSYWVGIFAFILILLTDCALVALSFRRARVINGVEVMTVFMIVPVFQMLGLLYFCLAPAHDIKTQINNEIFDSSEEITDSTTKAALIGLLSGVGLCLATVLTSVSLGLYGASLFLGAPFIIGITTSFIVNKKKIVSFGHTLGIVCSALLFGSFALLGFAIEGFMCLIMASPIIFLMGSVGALLGRSIAKMTYHRSTMMSLSLFPLMLVVELVSPPHSHFESAESIDVAAPPAAVWDSVVHMGPIPDAPAIPFRWGLAYPMRGEIMGTGVGAIRRGIFSTGTAYERVTEWQPNYKLSFIVLSDPPSMNELMPYSHINTPHTQGYFRTRDARFTITPLANGKTRLTLATQHDLNLAPEPYWVPMAQWAIHANKVRVLRHFKDQAEASAAKK